MFSPTGIVVSPGDRASLRAWMGGAALLLVLVCASLLLGHRLDRQQNDDEARARATGGMAVTSDFGVFRHAGERFWQGEPLYRAGRKAAPAGERQNLGDGSMGFKYGPLFAMAFGPIAALPGMAAPAVWSGFNLLATLGLGWLMSRWVRRYWRLRGLTGAGAAAQPDLHAPAWWGWAGLVATLYFLQLNWIYGQTNLVFLFFLFGGLELYATGRPVCGGFLAGLVAGVRLTPLVFLPYFLYKRQWRAGLGMSLGLFVSYALPLAWWGPQEFTLQLQEWRSLIAADESLGALPEATDEARAAAGGAQDIGPAGTGVEPAPFTPSAPGETVDDSPAVFYLRPARYQSIQPMVLDTFALPRPAQARWKAAPWEGKRNFLAGALAHGPATVLAYSLAGIFCLACAGLCWRNYPATDLRHLLEWALVLTAMLIVSPYSERTHYAALLPALTLVMARALSAQSTPADGRGWNLSPADRTWAILWAVGAVLVFGLIAPPLLPGPTYDWYKACHGYVLGAMVLFCGLAAWLMQEHRRAEAVTKTPLERPS